MSEDTSNYQETDGECSVARAPSRPLVITVVNQGANKYGVCHGEDTLSGFTWDEMLGQVAALTAPDGVGGTAEFERPAMFQVVNQGLGGWALVVGRDEWRGLSFDELLGRIVELTFPVGRQPGQPLFRRTASVKKRGG